jgi:hypothetical protein
MMRHWRFCGCSDRIGLSAPIYMQDCSQRLANVRAPTINFRKNQWSLHKSGIGVCVRTGVVPTGWHICSTHPALPCRAFTYRRFAAGVLVVWAPPLAFKDSSQLSVLLLTRPLKLAGGHSFTYLKVYLPQGVMAMTRRGLPEPPTIFSGAAMMMAPVGGSWSRFDRPARPNLPLPCMR